MTTEQYLKIIESLTDYIDGQIEYMEYNLRCKYGEECLR